MLLAGDQLHIEDMPVVLAKRGGTTKREIAAYILAAIVRKFRPDHAYIELVGARPGQGVTSMFAFGKSTGLVIGVIAALEISMTFLRPTEWRKSTRTRQGKDGARLRAQQLFPAHAHLYSRKKDDGRADATLIAVAGEALQREFAR